MPEFDFRRERFVPSYLAPGEAKMTRREFKVYKRPGSRLPVYRFPPVIPNCGDIERYLQSDLHSLADGLLL